MDLRDVLDAAEAVGDRDEERREAFQREYDAFEAGELDSFDETRGVLARERTALDELRDALDAEVENIDELVDYAEFLTAEQAVRHRDETVEKLRAHNDHLRTFREEMSAALDAVESNLDALEADGPDAVDADPQPHFERARQALERHNEAVDELGTNLTILNAYLV